jgi:serine/threonine-protein kinase
MKPPIPEELWKQIPPAAQAAILGVILDYEQQLRNRPAPAGPAGGPPPVPGVALPRAADAGSMADFVGRTISNFEIKALIAAGNTGAIFKARDTTKPGRAVAFQILRPELSADEDKERFAKTMTSVRSLKHPSLVRVYSAGKTGPNRWIAMKYVDGESLAELQRRTGVAGRLDWRTTYQIAVALARGLEIAHKQNVLHRNLKPANVLIRSQDRRAMIGDWSRARPLHGARVDPVPWPGQLVGDLTYLAPEQTQPGTIEDARCDIYRLGATIYSLLAGRPPFEAGTIDLMVQKIRGEEPPRPKEFQLAIPEALEGMVTRTMSKRPDVRFQTAAEVVAELERISRIHRLPFDPDDTGVTLDTE